MVWMRPLFSAVPHNVDGYAGRGPKLRAAWPAGLSLVALASSVRPQECSFLTRRTGRCRPMTGGRAAGNKLNQQGFLLAFGPVLWPVILSNADFVALNHPAQTLFVLQLCDPSRLVPLSLSDYYRERAGNILARNYEALTGAWTAITSDGHPNPNPAPLPLESTAPQWLAPRRMGVVPFMKQHSKPLSRPLEFLFRSLTPRCTVVLPRPASVT